MGARLALIGCLLMDALSACAMSPPTPTPFVLRVDTAATGQTAFHSPTPIVRVAEVAARTPTQAPGAPASQIPASAPTATSVPATSSTTVQLPTRAPLPATALPTATIPPTVTIRLQPSPTAAPSPTPVPAKPATAPTAEGAFGPGTKQIPTDVKPGTYRGAGGSGCYWERLKGLSGETRDIIANNNAAGPVVVTIEPTDKAFNSSRCGAFSPLGPAIRADQNAPFGDGTYVVGLDIAPGTWRTDGREGCYWERIRDFSGEPKAVIANDNAQGSVAVTIASTDRGFAAERCGTWTKAAS